MSNVIDRDDGAVLTAPDLINDPFEAEQRAVAARVEEIFAAARVKDFDRLAGYHLDGPKFSKFDDFEPLDRQDAAQARTSEEEGLGAVTGFRYQLDDLKVDVFGPVAVTTFVLDSSFAVDGETIATRARATLVMVADGDHWRIAHEHFSSYKANP
ncbi:MAG TPA: nuclear transport factor 2 family protein [Egibacteraceae bacterium]|nr:nuclear transport factor 2 family protein [Egibacteraceae bacterium]